MKPRNHFLARKAHPALTDKSRKGSVDAPIQELIDEMNAHPLLCTTSSCSGRVTLFTERDVSSQKKGGDWIYVSHQIPDLEAIRSAIERFLGGEGEGKGRGRLAFRFEPFIVACECGSLDCAKRLVEVGRDAGFRESGIVLGKEKINATIRSTSRLEIPVCENGILLISDAFMEVIIQQATEKFRKNLEKINTFAQLFRKAFSAQTSPPPPDSPDMSFLESSELYHCSLQWKCISPRDSVSAKGLKRWGHSVCNVGDSVVVFGGYGGPASHQRLNDLVLFNPKTNSISTPAINGAVPCPRMGHASVSLGQHVYVLGGRTHPGNPLGDVYELDTQTWSFCQLPGTLSPRFRHTACAYENSKIIVVGGCTLEGPSNDVWFMDVAQEKRFSLVETSGRGPSPRMSHGACVQGDWLFLHGGFSDYGHVYNDLFRLHLCSFCWEEITLFPFHLPHCFSHSLVSLNEHILAFVGGCRQSEPEKIVLADPEAKDMRIMRTEMPSGTSWVPIRQGALVMDGELVLIGGGAFCFSFGSVFSASYSLDLSPVIALFSSGVSRKVDMELRNGSSEKIVGVVARKAQAKDVKDTLKKLKWLDPTFKSTVLESGNRIAFPLLSNSLHAVYETLKAPLSKEWALDTQQKIADVAAMHEWMHSGVVVVQEMDFFSARANSAFPPHERLKRMVKSHLKELKGTRCEDLLQEVPQKWEKLGDLILLPADSMTSLFWKQQFGESLWRDMAEVLDGRRLAKQAAISQAGKNYFIRHQSAEEAVETRDSRVELLYGDNGWTSHKENGISFNLDVTKCMFSSGNVSERLRMARLPCQGEFIVDLYAGIGYYTLPLLIKGCAEKVFACEWNRNAVKALRFNLKQNRAEERCELRFGDCRKLAPREVANRVILGLLPSSSGGWKTALAALTPSGGWLHLHENVKDTEEESWIQQTLQDLAEMAAECGREWSVTLKHCEHVKWYAPHIRHVVLDILCQPLPTEIAHPASTLSTANAVPVKDSPSKEQFWSEIVPGRRPTLIRGVELGFAVKGWTAEYLASLPESGETLVSAHVFVEEKGLMNFVHRNFQFHTMSFSDLIQRCSPPHTLPPFLKSGEHYYLRSIGKNPRKDRSWLHVSFPRLAQDLQLPQFVGEDQLFSTVLRITGRKLVKLWPPSDDHCLYITGSSSEVVDIESPDLHLHYPNFKPAPLEVQLHPGDVLYVPALWFHNISSESFSVSVNLFFRHLPEEIYDRKDLYGNRDPLPIQEATKSISHAVHQLHSLPPDFQQFYGRRLLGQLEDKLSF